MNRLFLLQFYLLHSFREWTTKLQSFRNGKDLSGWTGLMAKPAIKVEHGGIGYNCFQRTQLFLATNISIPATFILELNSSFDDDMNSGIQFRSESKPDYKTVEYADTRRKLIHRPAAGRTAVWR